MGEQKEKDDTVSDVEKPSAAAMSEPAATGSIEKSTAVASVDGVVQGDVAGTDGDRISAVESVNSEVEVHGQGECRVEGSSSENMATEEGGSTHTGDVMVGVVCSDVNVDAVANIGDESEGKLSREAATCAASVEAGSGRDLGSVDCGGPAVDDSGSRVIREEGEHVLDLGTEEEDGMSSKVAELVGGEGGREVSDDGGSGVVNQKSAPKVAAVDVDAKSVEIGSQVDGTLAEVREVGGRALDLGIEREDGSSSKNDESEGGEGDREVSDGGRSAVTDQKSAHEVASIDIDAKGVEIASQVDGTDLVEGSLGSGAHDEGRLKEVFVSGKEGVERSETSVAAEDVDSREVGTSGKAEQDKKAENEVGDPLNAVDYSGETLSAAEKAELAEVALKKAKEAEGNMGDSIQFSETQKVDVSQSELQNHKTDTETALMAASTILKDSNVATTVVDVETLVIASNENSHPKAEASSSGAMETTPAGLTLETVSVSREKDGTPQIASNSLGEQAQVAVEGRVASMDNNDVTCPNVEGMDTDAFNENFCFSVEELQATYETINGSTENGYNAFADPAQLVGGEVTATESKLLSYSSKNENLIVDCLGQRKTPDSSEVLPNEQFTYAGHANLQKEQKVTDAEHRQNVEAGSGNTEKTTEQQSLEMETVGGSSVINTLVMVGEETAEAVSGKGLYQEETQELVQMDTNLERRATHDEHADAKQVYLHDVHDMDDGDHVTDDWYRKNSEEKSVNLEALHPEMSLRVPQARYELPPEDESAFFVSDLVWGKVRSHPWWPGQIFDPCDASEKAMKYQKKDSFLVAYFGDKTFAWNEASLLKPFRSHFSQAEKQGSSEAFQNAVDSALEEVSRRVELGLACSCIPSDVYSEIKFQILENAGIREESSTREAVDESIRADLFAPCKLVEYVKELAKYPDGGADRVELVILKSQLTAFNRQKGYSELPEFQFFEGLENTDGVQLEEEATEHSSSVHGDNSQILSAEEFSESQRSSYNKRKHNLKDGIYPRKKERNMSDLMGESWDSVDDDIVSDGKGDGELVSPSSVKKQKVLHSFADESYTPEGRKTISLAKVSASTSCSSKPSFKIGECISRVASLMTGSPSILKGNNQKLDGNSDGLVWDGSDASLPYSEDAEIKKLVVPAEYSSLDELISQLQLAAQDPYEGYSFLNIIISFFSDFRNSVIVDQQDKVGGKRKKTSNSFGGFAETFEFEDMSDTYWTDRVIQNGSEEQPSRKSRKKDNLFVPVILDKPLGRPNSRKRFSEGSYDASAQKPVGYVDENAPTELVMHFPVADSVPSETKLNKMFKHFGPINESETEVDRDTNRARVVFKKCSDAEVAYGSAPKFNIFGSMLVNYQLNYTVSVPFKTPPSGMSQFEEDATLFLEY